ncbi:MAG: hypothetical protein WCK02_15575 [Bacteroidota bacterium]
MKKIVLFSVLVIGLISLSCEKNELESVKKSEDSIVINKETDKPNIEKFKHEARTDTYNIAGIN